MRLSKTKLLSVFIIGLFFGVCVESIEIDNDNYLADESCFENITEDKNNTNNFEHKSGFANLVEIRDAKVEKSNNSFSGRNITEYTKDDIIQRDESFKDFVGQSE